MAKPKRSKPGSLRKRIAADLLSSRLEYDPEKGESWIVVSAAARLTAKSRRSGVVEPRAPRVDVIGIDPDPYSLQQALLTFYAIGTAVGTLSEEGNRLLGIIQAKSPLAFEAMKKWIGQDPPRALGWPKEYPTDHPYHG
jgi:hypothetical protein